MCATVARMDELFERRLDKLTEEISGLRKMISDINSQLRSIAQQLTSIETQNRMNLKPPVGGALGGQAKTLYDLGHRSIGETKGYQ